MPLVIVRGTAGSGIVELPDADSTFALSAIGMLAVTHQELPLYITDNVPSAIGAGAGLEQQVSFSVSESLSGFLTGLDTSLVIDPMAGPGRKIIIGSNTRTLYVPKG